MRAPDGYHYCGRQASAGREDHPMPAGCAGGAPRERGVANGRSSF